MVLVIDTSSARSALALLDGAEVVAEDVSQALRADDLARRVVALGALTAALDAVAIALGPGSFTGTRAGAGYGVGLALGRGIPLLGLGTLDLAAGRAREPATALSEAGRGRLYHRSDGDVEVRHGPPDQLPKGLPATGWLRPETLEAVARAGVRMLGEAELDGFGVAAGRLIEGAQKLGYDRVRLAYMSSFGPLRG